jgi:arylsulfatase A-like enzyme
MSSKWILPDEQQAILPTMQNLAKFICLLPVVAAVSLPAKSPNLVVILTDDQGYHDVGFNGCSDIPTPHIDSIASQGVRFTNGYVSFPVCGPSRAGLLTGRYQDRFGFTTNPTIDPENPVAGIPLEEKNIAETLREAGYKSAIIGKWHMGSHPVHHPLNRGFDHFFGFLSGGHNYFPDQLTLNDLSEVKRKWQWYNTRIMRDHERVDIDDYLTDELTDAATAFIDRQAQSGEPFFLYLAYNAPHTPLQATEKYLSRFPHIKDGKRRTYAAMVSAVDDGVGRLMETLRRHGIEEDTLVFFLSDNGGATNNASENTPLRGHKGTLWEGGIRVPFAMQWKGTVPSGKDFEHPVISLDIMGTITALAGVDIAPERPLDGVNLVPYLTGEKDGRPHEILFWRKWEQNAMAIRAGDIKVVSDRQRQKRNHAMFDLSRDVSESNDWADRSDKEFQVLLGEWEAWNSELKDRIFPTLGDDNWWEK